MPGLLLDEAFGLGDSSEGALLPHAAHDHLPLPEQYLSSSEDERVGRVIHSPSICLLGVEFLADSLVLVHIHSLVGFDDQPIH